MGWNQVNNSIKRDSSKEQEYLKTIKQLKAEIDNLKEKLKVYELKEIEEIKIEK